MLYETKYLTVKGQQENKFDVVDKGILHWISGDTGLDRFRNDCIKERIRVAPIVEINMTETRLR